MRNIELEVISILGKSKAIKIVLSKKVFDLDTISIEQFIEPKIGKVIKKYTSLSVGESWFKINRPYEEIKELMINKSIPILGFISKTKRYGKKENN